MKFQIPPHCSPNRKSLIKFSKILRFFFASPNRQTYSNDVATAGRDGGFTEKMGSSTLPQPLCRMPVATAWVNLRQPERAGGSDRPIRRSAPVKQKTGRVNRTMVPTAVEDP